MKGFLVSAVLFFLLASPAWGAFAHIGSLGTAASTSSASTLALTTSAILEAGNIGILVVAKDNSSSSDGDNNECTSVTDSAGNPYSELRDYTYAESAAGAAATVCVWVTRATTQFASCPTLTINFTSAITSKAVIFREFTAASGNTIKVASGGAVDANGDSIDPPSMTISGLASKEYLFLRAIAAEYNSGTGITATANYTGYGVAVADTGSSTTSQNAFGEFRILSGTGDTSDPTKASFDSANTYLALEEVPLRQPMAVILF